jgi:predicted ferric reductase
MQSRFVFMFLLFGAMVGLPLVIWALELGSEFTASLSDMGRLAGMAGLSLIAVSMVLGLKLRFFDRASHGLNRQYAIHHLTAAFGFVLVILHPILSAFGVLRFSAAAAREVLFPMPLPVETVLGWAAWLLFSAVMVTTFFLRPPYRGWRIVHFLVWPAFFIGWAHGVAFSGPGPILGVPLSYALLFMFVLGAVAIRGWLLVARPYNHQYKVVEKRRLSGKMAEFRLQPVGRRLVFEPGQFAYVRLEDSRSQWKCGEYHPYTISSAPGDEFLSFTIKALGDCSTHVLEFAPGATARIHGPYGKFLPAIPSARKQIWIGGGVGITPFLSAVRSLRGRDAGEIQLFYCEDSIAGALYLDELQSAAVETKGLNLHPVLADRDGYPNVKMIARAAGDWDDAEVYLCGPVGMTDALTREFKASGFPAARLHVEEFAFL